MTLFEFYVKQKFQLRKVGIRPLNAVLRYKLNENSSREDILKCGSVGLKTTADIQKLQQSFKNLKRKRGK